MNSKSGNDGMWDNTAEPDNEFINNIAVDLTTLINTEEPQHKNCNKYKKHKTEVFVRRCPSK